MTWEKLWFKFRLLPIFYQLIFDVIYTAHGLLTTTEPKLNFIKCMVRKVILWSHSGKVKYGARGLNFVQNPFNNHLISFICISCCWDLKIFKQACHSFAFIHHSLNDSIVSDLVWTDSREGNEPSWTLEIKTSLRKTSIQLFSSTAVKSRLSSMLLSLSCRKSDTGHHSMPWSIVFNKASEELSTPVCLVRLISTANKYVSKITKKMSVIWHVCGMVDPQSDIIPQWMMLNVSKLTAWFHKLQ